MSDLVRKSQGGEVDTTRQDQHVELLQQLSRSYVTRGNGFLYHDRDAPGEGLWVWSEATSLDFASGLRRTAVSCVLLQNAIAPPVGDGETSGDTFSGGAAPLVAIPMPFPIQTANVKASAFCDDGEHRVVLVDAGSAGKRQWWVEVWTTAGISEAMALDGVDAVVSPGFSTLDASWGAAGVRVLLCGEAAPPRPPPTGSSFFQIPCKVANMDGGANGGGPSEGVNMSDPDKGGEYAWRQDWGEQLVGVTEPTIYALEAGGLLRMPAVDGWCFGDGVWAPDGSGIVCVGYATTSRLGLVYCKNRKSALFYVPYQSPVVDAAGKVATAAAWGEPARLTREYAARSPRFSPSGNVLVYLALDECVTHNTTHKLATLAWSDAVANAGNGLVTGFVVIDTVDRPADAGAFPGLYPGELPKRCFLSETQVVTHSIWRGESAVVAIDLEAELVVRIDDTGFGGGGRPGASVVLDVAHGLILATCSDPTTPEFLALGRVAGVVLTPDAVDVRWEAITPRKAVVDAVWERRTLGGQPDDEFEITACLSNAPYAGGSHGTQHPAVLYPHGGPHSAAVAGFSLADAHLLALGYDIYRINYRGSIGFGQAKLDSLVGHCGSHDVADVEATRLHVLEAARTDRDRVAIMGGSHGGFLTLHSIGLTPARYRAAVSRNPVTNVATMIGSSDIPDWCQAIIGKSYDPSGIDAADYSRLFDQSPMASVDAVETPLLMLLGGGDRRVPPSQGAQYVRALEATGATHAVRWYPRDTHPLASPGAVADAIIQTALWFDTHLA